MPFFDWSRTKGSKLPPCNAKPTGMKVTLHWSHAKVQSCTLAPQLHYSASQASLVSRNAFRVDLFRISRKIFYLCVFPHLRAAPGSPVGDLLVFKQLVSFQKQKPPSCGHICGSTCISLKGQIPPVFCLMPQPNSASLRQNLGMQGAS